MARVRSGRWARPMGAAGIPAPVEIHAGGDRGASGRPIGPNAPLAARCRRNRRAGKPWHASWS